MAKENYKAKSPSALKAKDERTSVKILTWYHLNSALVSADTPPK